MKKLIFAASLLIASCMSLTSCGGQGETQTDNDTIFNAELTDSISMSIGSFNAGMARNQLGYTGNAEFIKGVQLIVGSDFSPEQLQGMLFAQNQIEPLIQGLKSEGLDVNRDLVLQEFRKVMNDKDFTDDKFMTIYENYNKAANKISEVISLREQKRAAATTQPADDTQAQAADVNVAVDEENETQDTTTEQTTAE